MARLFDDLSSQYLEHASGGLVPDPPFTMAAFAFLNDDLSFPMILASNESTSPLYYAHFGRAGSSDFLQFAYRGSIDSLNTIVNTSASTFLINTWYHLCGVAINASTANAFIDGGNKASTSSGAFDSFSGNNDSFRVGARMLSGSISNEFSGSIAETALWNVALTDAEVAMLALGYSPRLVRPANLIAYWPIIGRLSPEIDLVGGFDMTVTNGPTASAHPRVIYPKPPVMAFPPAAAVDVAANINISPGANYIQIV